MERILLDTNFWIHFKENPDCFEDFYSTVNQNDYIEVIFAFPNFIDLIKYHKYDDLAKIISHTADSYLPPLPDSGGKYPVTNDPLSLVPDQSFQQELREKTAGFDEEEKLRSILRCSDVTTPEYDLGEQLHRYRSITEEYDIEHLKSIVFDEYLELGDDGMYHLDQSDIDIIEFVKNMSLVYRISILDPNENPSLNDMNDIALCASAIVCECSIFAIEEKWVNEGLIDDLINDLLYDQKIDTVVEYDELTPTVKNHIKSE